MAVQAARVTLQQRSVQRITHVPYRTVSADAMNLVSVRLGSAFLPPATARPFTQRNQIRAIAIAGAQRYPCK